MQGLGWSSIDEQRPESRIVGEQGVQVSQVCRSTPYCNPRAVVHTILAYGWLGYIGMGKGKCRVVDWLFDAHVLMDGQAEGKEQAEEDPKEAAPPLQASVLGLVRKRPRTHQTPRKILRLIF